LVTSVIIPMGEACKWAYPGQATGQISGSSYSIMCLGANGQPLGGFNGAYSLNAWCASRTRTDGLSLPAPELVNGVWRCTGPGSQPVPSASPSGPVWVPIPMGAACKWAYPGQATGQISGSSYSIMCLGANGQPLGGFNGAHSLNAWCADSRHTEGKHTPTPALVKGQWVCTT
jgi:hypothetical protein